MIKNKHLPKEVSDCNILMYSNLEYEVFTCKEAADIKKIPLKNELKTMILTTTKGYVAVHLRGDMKVNLREVKNILNCKEAYLCSLKELEEMGLSVGTVNPFNEYVWYMHHLISKDILSMKYVSTNNGTRKGYYLFSPKVLLLTKKHYLGKFSLEN